LRKYETSNPEEPVLMAFEIDESTGLYHVVTDKRGYDLFQEFIDVYCSNVSEEMISDVKN
jgi:hypothetical protein